VTAVIGVFDEPSTFDKALEKLYQSGLKDDDVIVIDHTHLSRKEGLGVGPAILPGLAPTAGGEGVAGSSPAAEPGAMTLVTFENELAHLKLPGTQIEYYANIVVHDGRLIVVKTNNERAPEVMDMMRASKATNVNRHG